VLVDGFFMLQVFGDANGICAGYSLFSAVIAAMPRPSTMPPAWTFFLLDQVITSHSFLISSCNKVLATLLKRL